MEWFDKRIIVHRLIFIYVIRLVVLLSSRFFGSLRNRGGEEDEEERLKRGRWWSEDYNL